MNGTAVADIVADQPDFTGAQIETVYSKVSGTYAVYRTAERVMVQFADDPELGREQRLALAPLNPIRGEINGLIDGWRSVKWYNTGRNQAKARWFDRRTADALTVALQGDQSHAALLLAAVKDDILKERTSIGRVEYMIVATLVSLLALIAGNAFRSPDLRFAIGVGAVGALFSIALGIRSRNIRTDLQRRDNVIDATLRIAIGAVSAIILLSLLKAEFVTVGLGKQPVDLTNFDAVLVIAILAGFSERMVGDFLGSVALNGTKAAPGEAASAAVAAEAKSAANEQNPRGLRSAVAESAGEQPDGYRQMVDGVHEHVDGCLCGIELTEDELTDDVELPEASGGVEKQAA